MSGNSGPVLQNFSPRGIAGCSVIMALAAMLAGCSGGVSRFDYASFANNSSDDGLTTSSLSPIPAESIYSGGAAANGTEIVRRDLPPPQSPRQMAKVQPQPYQPAPAPLQHKPYSAPQYQAPQYQAPQYQAPKARYQPPKYQAPQYQAPQYQAPVSQARNKPLQKALPVPPANKTVAVQKGDTLYKLAKKHDVTINELKSVNSLKTARLSIGQELIIPGAAAPAPAAPAGSYTVKSGDSLTRIAQKYGLTQSELQKANGISRPNLLKPGQKLKIPGKAAPAAVAKKQGNVRVASLGKDIPLPSSKPRRGDTAKSTQTKNKGASKSEPLPKPKPMAGNQFRWPVKGRIVAGFGKTPGGKHNDGINVAVPAGTSIKAAENGVIAYAGSELEPYGNLILIRHANNWVTAYAHSDKLLVKRGDTVRRGQIIAKAGKSGNVSQPQLHFELRKGSKPVNPLSYMASS